MREAIHIGREGGLPVQISHVKAAGRPNWGKVADALALIDAARAEGLDVMADVYPYTASSTSLRTLLPDWVARGRRSTPMLERLARPERDASGIRAELDRPGQPDASRAHRLGEHHDRLRAERAATREGRRLRRDRRGAEPAIRSTPPSSCSLAEGGKGSMILFQLDEADLRRALAHPQVMIGSDGSALAPDGEMGGGKPHPRSYGTFPRVLGEYAREQRVLSLPQAVHKMTGLPARRLGLRDRGVIRGGRAGPTSSSFDAAPGRRPRDLRGSAPYPLGHRARARQRALRHQGRRAHRQPPGPSADPVVTRRGDGRAA